MGSLFKSKQESTSSSKATTNETGQITPFSGQAQTNYNNYYNATANSANNAVNNIGNMVSSGAYKTDTSKMDTAYNGMANMDLTNIKNLSTQSYDPYQDTNYVNAENKIHQNAMRGWGTIQDQTNQNFIKNGMANGSGHQDTMGRQASDFMSQLSANEGNRYLAQYNANRTASMQATEQLQGFYKTLEGMGVDYANISQEDLQTLFKSYTAQNEALSSWGSAVEMGANPTTTASSTSTANGKNTTTSSGGLGQGLLSLGTAYFGYKACFVAGTLISTPDGEVPIEVINIGDMVITPKGVEEVIDLYNGSKPIVSLQTEFGQVYTTEGQRFMTENGLVEIQNLNIGDKIQTQKGFEVITDIYETKVIEKVYELDVTGDNIFYANGFVVDGMTEAE